MSFLYSMPAEPTYRQKPTGSFWFCSVGQFGWFMGLSRREAHWTLRNSIERVRVLNLLFVEEQDIHCWLAT